MCEASGSCHLVEDTGKCQWPKTDNLQTDLDADSCGK